MTSAARLTDKSVEPVFLSTVTPGKLPLSDLNQ